MSYSSAGLLDDGACEDCGLPDIYHYDVPKHDLHDPKTWDHVWSTFHESSHGCFLFCSRESCGEITYDVEVAG